MKHSSYHKLKLDSSEKINCIRRRRWLCVRRILYKGVVAHSQQCSRHWWIDKAESDAPVSVVQSADYYLNKAVLSVSAMRTKCLSLHVEDTFQYLQPYFRVVQFSSIHCFETRITVLLLLSTRAAIARQIILF